VQWERLRQANAFKREMVGTVAHDLKNPLGVVMGRSEMLKELVGASPLNADLAREQIRHVEDSGRRMLGMVEALLADAMEDALDINLKLQPCDLAALVREVVDSSRQTAERKRQKINVQGPDSLIVQADSDRMWETIDNLVSNAIKYTQAGGTIDIGVERGGDKARITVRDNGQGLFPEDISRVFGRFQRLSAKPTGGETSTGLGLSIVKKIVDLHGGHITVESPGPQKGATFAVTLPLERSPSAV
jgi:signal transduction histidine kinase